MRVARVITLVDLIVPADPFLASRQSHNDSSSPVPSPTWLAPVQQVADGAVAVQHAEARLPYLQSGLDTSVLPGCSSWQADEVLHTTRAALHLALQPPGAADSVLAVLEDLEVVLGPIWRQQHQHQQHPNQAGTSMSASTGAATASVAVPQPTALDEAPACSSTCPATPAATAGLPGSWQLSAVVPTAEPLPAAVAVVEAAADPQDPPCFTCPIGFGVMKE